MLASVVSTHASKGLESPAAATGSFIYVRVRMER
jgi:hypothetical protein